MLLVVIATTVGGTAAAPYVYTVLLGCAVTVPLRLRGRPGDTAPAHPLPAEAPPDLAITVYGERLTRQPLHAADQATEWRLALDVYEEAKRAAPGSVPRILAEGHAALDRLAAEDYQRRHQAGTTAHPHAAAAEVPPSPAHHGPLPIDPSLWSHGSGVAILRLAKPDGWQGSYLLAFEAIASDGFLVHSRTGTTRNRRSVKLAGLPHGPGTARVPVPASAEETLTLEILTEGPWRAALLPARAARTLHGVVLGSADEVLINRAGHRSAVFEHHGPGGFVVREPNATAVTAGRIIAEGEGTARLHLGLHDIQTVHVESDDDWTLTAHHAPNSGNAEGRPPHRGDRPSVKRLAYWLYGP